MIDTLLDKGRREKLVKLLGNTFPYQQGVLDAIGLVPRHFFVESGLAHLAYEDKPLSIAAKQTISQPSTVAFQTHLLELKAREKILEIGTGCGYQTAILSAMGARVYSVERIKELYIEAQKNLVRLGFDRAIVVLADGNDGLMQFAPFKKILVTCACHKIPLKLVQQLEIGGLMVVPVAETLDVQQMIVVKRIDETNIETKSYGNCSFVPMLSGVVR